MCKGTNFSSFNGTIGLEINEIIVFIKQKA